MEWHVIAPPLQPGASLNMARLKKAIPHASAALTSATINTPQKSMKSQAVYEIPPLDRAASVRWKTTSSWSSPMASECGENVRGAYIYSCGPWEYTVNYCTVEMSEGGSLLSIPLRVQWHWTEGCMLMGINRAFKLSHSMKLSESKKWYSLCGT